MELRVTMYLRNDYDKIGELTLDGFYNEVFMDVMDKTNADELLAIGLLNDKVDLSKFIPDENHQGLENRGYTRDEDPEVFKNYKDLNLPQVLEFYRKFRAIAEGQPDKLKQLGDDNLRQYYIEQLDKLINVFELCLKNGYKCHFTAYGS